ncbi:aminotransferase class V-fold PLP-dependent enzyme [Nostocoides sp. F2B08]|uniref:pyridoxal phosphate-dependent decarboxylase family protein n=1 Tax=Nostocoides sp. F2B08 TaxID=2653936 RepID=UPI001D051170|nr:aminotransferase class V-fold PLP-dependent enzyme [Tetrasphaera sp. F2B08]
MPSHPTAEVSSARLADVRRRLDELRAHDLPTHGGRTLAYVYDSGLADVDALGREALGMFASTNGLDPTAFPSLLRMENDLVAWAARLLDGPESVGAVTSGGTESVLLAVLAARDARPDVDRPQMVLPTTAHAAFHKAAHYFGVEPVLVDVDPRTYRADPAATEAALTDRTVLVVASAPSYAHGVVDPVPELAALASEAGIRCHVDACIGGWALPYLTAVDRASVPAWTFAVPGVSSISVDLHKYAYTPKGVSLLLHRTPELRRPQYFSSAAWPGYTMLNSTMQSTKSGGPLAAAWAVTTAIGESGYAVLARQARSGAVALAAAVGLEWDRGVEHLRVVVEPDSTLVAVECDDTCDVFTVADEMLARGWFVQPQMAFRSMPATLHLTVSAATEPSVEDFVRDLVDSVRASVLAGPVHVDPGLAEAAATLDPAGLDDAAFDGLLQLAGLVGPDGPALPERMAPVNALLDAAPPPVREALLIAFLDRLQRPSP